ncbi:MAG: HAD-IA family hydrolase, partial [Actinomycetota bacterium]|nr:HAD-IA family hydrolase [Actinomycetota bacterium]
MKSGHGSGMSRTAEQAAVIANIMEMFEVVIESAKVGVRKPDPRIYEMACTELKVDPHSCAYLDDLGINCKPAAALGMTAIKVVDPEQALDDLEQAVGFSLR